MQLEKLWNILKMYWSDEVVLLESCCSLLNYHHEQIKRKKKRTCVREIFLKNDRTKSLPKFIAGDTCQWKSITLQVIYVMNFLAKVVKKNVRPFRVWVGPLLFIKVLLKTAQMFPKHFSPGLSLFRFLYFPFRKGKDTSPIPQTSVHHLVCFTYFLSFSQMLW